MVALTSYYYFVSSLPMLRLGESVPISSEEYLDGCRSQLSTEFIEKIEQVALVPDGTPRSATEKQWQDWETYFRNALVRHRVEGTGKKPDQWLRKETDVFPGLETRIEEAYATENPASRQFALDEIRWDKLDDLSIYHPYDLGALVIYRLRLLLAEEWSVLDTDTGYDQLENILTDVEEQANNVRNAV